MWPFNKYNEKSEQYNQHQAPRRLEMPPPAPAKTGTVVLDFTEVCAAIPAMKTLGSQPISASSLALMHDTLRNSVVTPPAPWPANPVRFQYVILSYGQPPFFIFYPI